MLWDFRASGSGFGAREVSGLRMEGLGFRV